MRRFLLTVFASLTGIFCTASGETIAYTGPTVLRDGSGYVNASGSIRIVKDMNGMYVMAPSSDITLEEVADFAAALFENHVRPEIDGGTPPSLDALRLLEFCSDVALLQANRYANAASKKKREWEPIFDEDAILNANTGNALRSEGEGMARNWAKLFQEGHSPLVATPDNVWEAVLRAQKTQFGKKMKDQVDQPVFEYEWENMGKNWPKRPFLATKTARYLAIGAFFVGGAAGIAGIAAWFIALKIAQTPLLALGPYGWVAWCGITLASLLLSAFGGYGWAASESDGKAYVSALQASDADLRKWKNVMTQRQAGWADVEPQYDRVREQLVAIRQTLDNARWHTENEIDALSADRREAVEDFWNTYEKFRARSDEALADMEYAFVNYPLALSLQEGIAASEFLAQVEADEGKTLAKDDYETSAGKHIGAAKQSIDHGLGQVKEIHAALAQRSTSYAYYDWAIRYNQVIALTSVHNGKPIFREDNEDYEKEMDEWYGKFQAGAIPKTSDEERRVEDFSLNITAQTPLLRLRDAYLFLEEEAKGKWKDLFKALPPRGTSEDDWNELVDDWMGTVNKKQWQLAYQVLTGQEAAPENTEQILTRLNTLRTQPQQFTLRIAEKQLSASRKRDEADNDDLRRLKELIAYWDKLDEENLKRLMESNDPVLRTVWRRIFALPIYMEEDDGELKPKAILDAGDVGEYVRDAILIPSRGKPLPPETKDGGR